MSTSTDPQLLYLILFLGAFSGAILTWAFILATPNIINKRQNRIVEARQSLENELKQLMIAKSKLTDFNKTQQHSYSIEEIDLAINKERQRIAYELHDDTVQRMAAVRLRMEQLSYRIGKPEVLGEFDFLREEMNQIMKMLRYMIWGLALPEFEEKKLTPLLIGLLGKLEKVLHLKISYQCLDEEQEFFIQPAVKQTVYRMVQEVMQNFVNHSMGFNLTIKIMWVPHLKIVMQDNGQGIGKKPGEQLDLTSLQRRAKQIGAELSVYSTLGRGTCAIIEVKKL